MSSPFLFWKHLKGPYSQSSNSQTMLEFLSQQKSIKRNSVPWDFLVWLQKGYCSFKDNLKRHFTKYLGVWVLKTPFWISTKCMDFSLLLLFSPISWRRVCAITYPSAIPFSLISLYLMVNLNKIWHQTTELKTNIRFWVFKIPSRVEWKIYTILKEKLLQEVRSYLLILKSRMTWVNLNPGSSFSLLPRW